MASPKLDTAAKRLVIERVIAGDTNAEIRHKLRDAGHPFDLTDAAFSHYRDDKAVRKALERKDSEAVQSGYAQRSERILKLALSAKRFERMLAIEPTDPTFVPGKPITISMIHREYRDTLKDIGALVDPVKAQPIALNATVEIINSAAASADARFAAVAGKPAGTVVLGRTDDAGEGGA